MSAPVATPQALKKGTVKQVSDQLIQLQLIHVRRREEKKIPDPTFPKVQKNYINLSWVYSWILYVPSWH